MTDDGATTVTRARQALEQMSDLVGDRGHIDNSRRWDRLVDEWLADRRELAGTAEGRAAVTELMGDPRPAVRLWSAAAVLSWDPDAARPVLVAIRDFPLDYDLHSITAKQTLLAFDAGELDPDGRLPGT
ncbi:MAG TPA: hypothetical protein VHW64_18770 [Nocardioides sp.]|uniref:hypothetical protein n=1 Tax=Nocardioides sp. TaxID=35761 RepID=UPI002E2FAEE2|nr:hypothetical protein [Nocardioides sp.]HEX3932746.1 hypothetical protein [Nocardioides sp.]